MRNGKFHRRVAFAICTNPFHLPKNGRGGLKLVLKIMALKKWNTNFRLGNSGNSVRKNKTYLFSCSAALADFPRERPILYFPNGFSGNFFSCIMILYFPNGFSANFFQNDKKLLPQSFSWHHPLSV